MKKYYAIISIFSLMLITSCTKYNVTGTSSLQNMDGHMLYLKGIVNDELCNIDSCEVVHGKFKFSGTLDSVQVVTLCIDDSPIMPLVLEDGDVTVELNEQRLPYIPAGKAGSVGINKHCYQRNQYIGQKRHKVSENKIASICRCP